MDDKGYANQQYYKRYSFRANVTSEITNWLQMGGSLAYSYYRQNNSGANRALVFSNTLNSPWLRNEDNTAWYTSQKTGERIYDFAENSANFFGIHVLNNAGDYWNNPNDDNFDNYDGNMVTAHYFADFKLPFDLKFKTAVNLDDITKSRYTYDSAIHGEGQMKPYGVTVRTSGGSASRSNWRTTSLTWNNVLNWDKTFGDNTFNVMLGQEAVSHHSEGFQVYSKGQTSDLLTNVSSGTRASRWADSSSDYSYLSFFMRGEYNYKELYYADFSLRTDASSRFGKDHRWGTFWSLGFMYNVKSTDWLKDVKWLSSAQLAVSTGTSGNSEIPNYYHLALVSGGANYDDTAGFYPSQSGNEELGWESTWANNFALRLGFFDRINFSFEAYYKRTSNMLMRVPESYTVTGEGYRWKNVGVMANKGIELSADGDVIRTRDFTWNVSANVSYNQNRLKELYNGVTEYVNSTTGLKYVVGHSVSEFFLNRYAGVNPANGEQLWYDKDGNVTNEFRESDKVMMGKTYDAPWMGGFGTSLRWKGLQLSAQFSWIGTRYVINNDRFFEESGVTFGTAYNQSNRLLYDRWKNPGDITDIPRWGEVNQLDDRYLENASFLRMKNLSLSYSLPQSLLSKTKFFSLVRVYAQAQNLFTITGFNGLDPEVSSNVYQAQYPASRQFTLGVELSF